MKPIRRQDLMANAVPLESKEVALAPELKGLLDNFGSAMDEFKKTNDVRVAGIEKKFDDVVTNDKLAKVIEASDAFREDFNKKFAELQKARASNDNSEDELDEKATRLRNIEKKAFDRYIRSKEGERDMREAQALAGSPEYKEAAKAISEKLGIEIKDLSTIVAEDGGYMIQPEYEQDMDEILLETSPMRQVANVRSIGAPELVIPVNRKGTTAAWVGETGTRTATSTPEISQERFRAHEIYAYPLVTLSMLEDAQFDVEGWLHDEVIEAIMIEENLQFVTGNGNGKPQGFLDSAITKVSAATYDANTNWGSIAYKFTGVSGGFAAAPAGADALIGLVYDIKPRFRGNASWAMTRRTLGTVRTLKNSQGDYIIRDAITESGLVPVLLGYAVDEFEDMPEIAADTYSVAFADFERAYQIVDRVGIQVRRDEITQPGYVKFHFRKRTGGGVRNYDAIKLLKFGTS